MINNVCLMGRLVEKPELRVTTNGKNVTAFTIAVDRHYVKSGDERQTDFINLVVWGKTAEFVTRNFHKGEMFALVGSIQTRKYEDKNGNKRTATEIVVSEAHFCGDKKVETPSGQHTFTITTDNDIEEVGNDDDLPF